MTKPPNESSESPEINSKVARLISKYDLDSSFGDKIEKLWTAKDEERESLRSLAEMFNKQILKSAMVSAEMDPIAGEVDNVYRLLKEEDISSGDRTEVKTRLKQHNVPIEELERDFVSYQAIRTYLKEFRKVEYQNNNNSSRIPNLIQTIQRIKSRLDSIVDSSLTELRDSGQIVLGEYRVFININVLCEDCDTQYNIIELLQEGSCDCQSEGH